MNRIHQAAWIIAVLACAPAHGYSFLPQQGGEAMVALYEETVLASELLADVKREGYYSGIHELKMTAIYTSVTLKLDTLVEAEDVLFNAANDLLTLTVMNESGTLRRTTDGGTNSISRSLCVQVLFNPTETLTGDINWLVFDSPNRALGINSDNSSPFALLSTVEGLVNKGVVYSADEVLPGEVGLLVEGTLSGKQLTSVDSIRIIAKPLVQQAPEPATGTLGLLTLAGLTARRRRKQGTGAFPPADEPHDCGPCYGMNTRLRW